MFRNSKFTSKNYYVSPYPEAYLRKLQTRNVVLVIAALVLYLPILVLWIYPGLRCAAWISNSYEGTFALVAVYALGVIGLGFCLVNSFYGYKIRKEVKHKDAPLFGFHKMSYNGQLVTVILVSALSLFVLVLLIGYSATNSYADQGAGNLPCDIIILILSALSTAAAWVYYLAAYNANKAMQYVRPNSDKQTAAAPAEQKINKPIFMLSKEEKDQCASEFMPTAESKDKEDDN